MDSPPAFWRAVSFPAPDVAPGDGIPAAPRSVPWGSFLSRAVCRTCWTWYANGETLCPKCRTRLMGADVRAGASVVDAGAPTPIVEIPPAGLAQPTVDAPFPGPAQPSSSSLTWWQWWLIGRAALAVIAVATAIVGGLFLTGVFGPVKSSDGAFSVRVPT